MSTKNKIFLIISLLFIFLNFSFANSFEFNNISKENISNEEAKQIAENYINNMYNGNIFGLWKNNNPQINGEGVYFYTDKESPSYIEYKISCDTEIDCGSMFVNLDGDGARVPTYTYSGKASFETLKDLDKTNQNDDYKLYYFGFIDHYIENKTTGNFESVIPYYQEENIKTTLEKDLNRKTSDKISPKAEKNEFLKEHINNIKTDIKEYKKTDEFKEKLNEIKDREKIELKNINRSNTIISGSTTTSCDSPVPCYNQFILPMGCKTGCGPTAVGIYIGYFNREKGSYYKNLYDSGNSTAPIANPDPMNKTFSNFIHTIRIKISTNCFGGANKEDVYKGIKDYSIDKGYKNTTSSYETTWTYSGLYSDIKTHIDNGKPVILFLEGQNNGNHAVVVYGYNNGNNTLIANFGWGNGNFSSKSFVYDDIFSAGSYTFKPFKAYTIGNISK